MRKAMSCMVGALLVHAPASAFTDDLPDHRVVDTRPSTQAPGLPTVEGALAWSDLDRFRALDETTAVPVELSTSMRSIARSGVKVAGYMIPIEGTSGQRHFFLAATPAPCDFGFPDQLPTLIEVTTTSPIVFTNEAIVVSGTFALSGAGRSVKYRLDDAARVPTM